LTASAFHAMEMHARDQAIRRHDEIVAGLRRDRRAVVLEAERASKAGRERGPKFGDDRFFALQISGLCGRHGR
jgi:hypothetical protein